MNQKKAKNSHTHNTKNKRKCSENSNWIYYTCELEKKIMWNSLLFTRVYRILIMTRQEQQMAKRSAVYLRTNERNVSNNNNNNTIERNRIRYLKSMNKCCQACGAGRTLYHHHFFIRVYTINKYSRVSFIWLILKRQWMPPFFPLFTYKFWTIPGLMYGRWDEFDVPQN